MNQAVKDGFLKDTEVAQLLSVSLGTVRRWRMLGTGPKAIKLAGSVRYRLADVEEWINARPTLGTQEAA